MNIDLSLAVSLDKIEHFYNFSPLFDLTARYGMRNKPSNLAIVALPLQGCSWCNRGPILTRCGPHLAPNHL